MDTNIIVLILRLWKLYESFQRGRRWWWRGAASQVCETLMSTDAPHLNKETRQPDFRILGPREHHKLCAPVRQTWGHFLQKWGGYWPTNQATKALTASLHSLWALSVFHLHPSWFLTYMWSGPWNRIPALSEWKTRRHHPIPPQS